MITVTAGQSLRAAILNAPATETVISVEAGSVFNEVIELPARERSVPLVIQSSRISELPEGKPVSPVDAVKLVKVIPPVNADPQRAILTKTGARHYSFAGVEVAHDPSGNWHTLISLGDPAQRTLEEIPHSLVFDRCYVHGHPDRSSVRGVALNSAKTDILNCYISDIHSNDVDSQAICGWAGPGPYRIENCYLGAAGENVMFGGADPLIAGLIPSDILMRRCHFFKPLTWKVDDPSYAGRKWIVKNLFETKNARRIVLDGCVLENCWRDAQVGFALVLKSNNQDSTAPWSVTEDLTVSNSIIRNVEHGVNILGFEYPPKISGMTKELKFLNVFWEVRGIWLQITRGGEGIEFDHNLFLLRDGSTASLGDLSSPGGDVATKGLVIRNSIGTRSGFGIKGDSVGEGLATLKRWAPDAVMEQNVLVGAEANLYPVNNFYPASLPEVGFVDLGARNYRLASTSPYRGKDTDGKDLGVDWDAMMAAQTGTANEPPPPPPPDPPPPSPDGTKAIMITDNDSGVWTIGPAPELPTLRNGTRMSNGRGKIYKWWNSTVYVLGTNDVWYRWAESAWVSVGSEPGVVVVPPPPPPPLTCSITAPVSVTIPRNSSGVIAVQLNDLTGAVTVNVVGSDGQVTVTPLSWNAGPTSTVKQFQVRVKNKKQVRELKFQSGCGTATVRVNVT